MGRKLSEEHKNKISESNKGHKAWNKGHQTSEEVKDKISNAVKGEKNGFYRKTHTEESIEKIRSSNIGREHSEETKLKMSVSSKRMYYPHLYGKSVLQYDMDNNFMNYPLAKD